MRSYAAYLWQTLNLKHTVIARHCPRVSCSAVLGPAPAGFVCKGRKPMKVQSKFHCGPAVVVQATVACASCGLAWCDMHYQMVFRSQIPWPTSYGPKPPKTKPNPYANRGMPLAPVGTPVGMPLAPVPGPVTPYPDMSHLFVDEDSKFGFVPKSAEGSGPANCKCDLMALMRYGKQLSAGLCGLCGGV